MVENQKGSNDVQCGGALHCTFFYFCQILFNLAQIYLFKLYKIGQILRLTQKIKPYSVTTDDYKAFSPTIPKDPGVYRFLAKEGTILYVGKAKNLKNRLNSYFSSPKQQTAKTRRLVKHADRIEFTIVDSEADALLLESMLIKNYQPRYNVMLKDEKSPLTYICVKKERFPRVFMARKVFRDGSTYFGPYVSKQKAFQLLDLIRQLFMLRNCKLNLSKKNIEAGKFKPCLEYHIKKCAAPCVDYESEEEYDKRIEQVKNVLKGQFSVVKDFIKEEMAYYAENLQFEKAQEWKEKLNIFTDYQSKSTVVSTSIRDVDVFALAGDEEEAYVNYLKIVNGAVIHTYTLALTKNLDEDPEVLLTFAIQKLRERFNSIAEEIITAIPLSLPEEEGLTVTIPKIGDKKKLLELSEKNVQYYYLQKKKQAALYLQKETNTERILKTIKSDLQMKELPVHIECFDNSNLMGTHPTSSCVVFRNAKPAKRDYRHYNIKTVEGPDDFASMEEVVYRRYKRLLAEGSGLPQLVIIDGGKGQLSAAMKSVNALGIADKMVVVGIAKRLEEIFFPNDSIPIYINKKSESLKVIQQCRNEAHRFAITFHRDKRSQFFTTTELTDIQGIGEKTAEKLLQHFGSVKRIKEADDTALQKLIGKAATAKLRAHFSKE